MKIDNQGQVSLEYLLIFAISLIILVAFTLPLAEISIENTMDITNVLNAKSDLSKISSQINQVYNEGEGSKHTVFVHKKNSIKIKVEKNKIYSNLKLNNGDYKKIKTSHKSNLKSTSLYLYKGKNILVIEWPVSSDKMVIYRK